jgi:hypothetical protein
MNRDDIIRMAREAGIVVTGEAVWKLCELVAVAEREACAKVCEEEIKRVKPLYSVTAENCVKAIRARGAGMTTDREAMQMALKALEYEAQKGNDNAYEKERSALRTALSRKALDELAEIDRELGLNYMQPDLARVGEVGVWGSGSDTSQERVDETQEQRHEPVIDKSAAKRIATQLGWEPKREWQGLTDEEYTELWGKKPDLLNFFRKIEAKLKERNT